MTGLEKLIEWKKNFKGYDEDFVYEFDNKAAEFLAEEKAQAKPAANAGYWWCQHCVREVHPKQVTYEENHDVCGARVEWRTDGLGDKGEE